MMIDEAPDWNTSKCFRCRDTQSMKLPAVRRLGGVVAFFSGPVIAIS